MYNFSTLYTLLYFSEAAKIILSKKNKKNNDLKFKLYCGSAEETHIKHITTST